MPPIPALKAIEETVPLEAAISVKGADLEVCRTAGEDIGSHPENDRDRDLPAQGDGKLPHRPARNA